jgi:hypothetical protein
MERRPDWEQDRNLLVWYTPISGGPEQKCIVWYDKSSLPINLIQLSIAGQFSLTKQTLTQNDYNRLERGGTGIKIKNDFYKRGSFRVINTRREKEQTMKERKGLGELSVKKRLPPGFGSVFGHYLGGFQQKRKTRKTRKTKTKSKSRTN